MPATAALRSRPLRKMSEARRRSVQRIRDADFAHVRRQGVERQQLAACRGPLERDARAPTGTRRRRSVDRRAGCCRGRRPAPRPVRRRWRRRATVGGRRRARRASKNMPTPTPTNRPAAAAAATQRGATRGRRLAPCWLRDRPGKADARAPAGRDARGGAAICCCCARSRSAVKTSSVSASASVAQPVHELREISRSARAHVGAVGQVLGRRRIERLAAPLGEVAVEQPIVVRDGARRADHGLPPSRPRSLRAARNRWTRTVDSFKPGHRADFARRAVAVVAQHEDGPLPAVEPIDGRRQPRRAARARAAALRDRASAAPPNAGRASSTPVASSAGANQPLAARARLAAIEAAVDENAREPDLERPRLAIRADVAEDLDERVLHGFVGFGGIAQVLIGDAQRPPLMHGDELGEPLARLVERRRARRGRESRPRAACRRDAAAPPDGAAPCRDGRPAAASGSVASAQRIAGHS